MLVRHSAVECDGGFWACVQGWQLEVSGSALPLGLVGLRVRGFELTLLWVLGVRLSGVALPGACTLLGLVRVCLALGYRLGLGFLWQGLRSDTGRYPQSETAKPSKSIWGFIVAEMACNVRIDLNISCGTTQILL